MTLPNEELKKEWDKGLGNHVRSLAIESSVNGSDKEKEEIALQYSDDIANWWLSKLASREKEVLGEMVKEIEGIVFKTDWIGESKSTYGKLLNLRDSLRSKLTKIQ